MSAVHTFKNGTEQVLSL